MLSACGAAAKLDETRMGGKVDLEFVAPLIVGLVAGGHLQEGLDNALGRFREFGDARRWRRWLAARW